MVAERLHLELIEGELQVQKRVFDISGLVVLENEISASASLTDVEKPMLIPPGNQHHSTAGKDERLGHINRMLF